MPFVKSVTLASGAVGEYHVLRNLRWDQLARELQCAIDLYIDAAAYAAEAEPIKQEFARFRVQGDQFDTCAGLAVSLENAADADGIGIIELTEVCIQETCTQYIADLEVTDPERYLVCDEGKDFYDSATIV